MKQHLPEIPELEHEFNGKTYDIYVDGRKFGRVKELPEFASAQALIHIGKLRLLKESGGSNNSLVVLATNELLTEELTELKQEVARLQEEKNNLTDLVAVRHQQIEELNKLVDDKQSYINDYKSRLEKNIKEKNDICSEYEAVKNNYDVLEQAHKSIKEQLYETNRSLKEANKEVVKLQAQHSETKILLKALKKAWKDL